MCEKSIVPMSTIPCASVLALQSCHDTDQAKEITLTSYAMRMFSDLALMVEFILEVRGKVRFYCIVPRRLRSSTFLILFWSLHC